MADDVRLEGGEDYVRRVRALAAFLQDLRPFWPIARKLWIGWVTATFESEGGFLGEPWEPLSESYQEWKARYFPGKPILSLKGDLRRHMTTPKQIAAPDYLELIVDPYEHDAIVYTNSRGGESRIPAREVAPGWFQDGTERMPRRPLIADPLNPAMSGELHEAAERYIDEVAVRLRLV